MISFSCASCNHVYKLPDKYAGKKAKCKKCNAIIRIPSELSDPVKSPLNFEFEEVNIPKDIPKPPVDNADRFTNTGQAGGRIAFDDDVPEDYKEIIDEIEKLNNPSQSWKKKLFILLLSLFLFARFGISGSGVSYAIALILVLFVHETGHLIGMYIFGYRNIQMFFIPFFGAAVSGHSRNVASYKKAIVTLLGPGPGLLLGGILLSVYAKTRINFLLLLSGLLLAINFFNMLPFYPLDGGRFMQEILFSRNRYLELVFKIFASLTLVILGYLLKFWFLAVIGAFGLLTLHFRFKLAGISNKLKISGLGESNQEEDKSEAGQIGLYKEVIDKIKGSMKGKLKAKTVAGFVHDVIEMASCRPPKIAPTIVLLVVYLFFCFTPLVMSFSMLRSGNFNTSKIIESQNTDGQKIYSEQRYLFGRLSSQSDLSEDRRFYHGKSVTYSLNGDILQQGNWFNGKWHGEWKVYDQKGNLTSVTFLDKGKFVSRKILEDGKWIEQSWDDLPFMLRTVINIHNDAPPQGPKLSVQESFYGSGK